MFQSLHHTFNVCLYPHVERIRSIHLVRCRTKAIFPTFLVLILAAIVLFLIGCQCGQPQWILEIRLYGNLVLCLLLDATHLVEARMFPVIIRNASLPTNVIARVCCIPNGLGLLLVLHVGLCVLVICPCHILAA